MNLPGMAIFKLNCFLFHTSFQCHTYIISELLKNVEREVKLGIMHLSIFVGIRFLFFFFSLKNRKFHLLMLLMLMLSFSSGIIDCTGAQTMLYLTCTLISSVDLAQYRVSHAKD